MHPFSHDFPAAASAEFITEDGYRGGSGGGGGRGAQDATSNGAVVFREFLV